MTSNKIGLFCCLAFNSIKHSVNSRFCQSMAVGVAGVIASSASMVCHGMFFYLCIWILKNGEHDAQVGENHEHLWLLLGQAGSIISISVKVG